MAGILNNRQRIFDTILTTEGKKQLAQGTLRFNFYSFTDSGMIYQEDTIVSGGLDATNRISLEATNLPQDQIAFEADDGGKLRAFSASGSELYSILQGQIYSGSTPWSRTHITGSQFNSLADDLLRRTIFAFQQQRILKSPDPLDDKERTFLAGNKNINFEITKNAPIGQRDTKTTRIDGISSLFYDKRLTHIPNFQFLPPRNKPRAGRARGSRLGRYLDINEKGYKNYNELRAELKPFVDGGFSEIVEFTETSRENNIMAQFFEVSRGEMRKLDVIDFGTFPTELGRFTRHVFFVGKVFMDDRSSPTFVNMFVLIFKGKTK
jgi:hypothetical protein